MAKSSIKKTFQIHRVNYGADVEGPKAIEVIQCLEDLIIEGLKGRGKYPVLLTISSCGGCIHASSAICAILQELKRTHELWTQVVGECSSAAIDMYLLGEKRFRLGSASMTFHRAHTVSGDEKYQTHDHEAAIKSLQEQDEILEKQFAKLNIPKKHIARIRAGQDVVFENGQLEDYGIVNTPGTVWDYIRRNYATIVKRPTTTGRGKRKRTTAK